VAVAHTVARRVACQIALLAFAGLLLGASAVSAASPIGAVPTASGPLIWSGPVRVDAGALNAVSCPTAALCVAVDDAGHVLTSTDPAGGPRQWVSRDVDGRTDITALSCPSASLCVATDAAGDVLTSTHAWSSHARWTVTHVDSALAEPSRYGGGPDLLEGVSCATVSLCVAVDSIGNAISSTRPAGGASAWALVHADGNLEPACTGTGLACQAALTGIACPGVSLCAAIDFAGSLLQTGAPTENVAWTSAPAAGSPTALWGLSCPAGNWCAAVDGEGRDLITWNPAAGLAVVGSRLPAPAFGIWCPSLTLCFASAEGASGTSQLLVSSDPTASAPRWTISDFGAFTGVVCPAGPLCVGVDQQGQVVAGETVSDLTVALAGQAFAPPLPSIRELLRAGGATLRFTSPLAGQFQLVWDAAAPAGGPGATGAALASATLPFDAPRTSTIPIRLTAAGRSALRTARRLPVTAIASFTTPSGTVTARRRLTLTGGRG
jgi:hypothetical protein